jgi:hypothetical protein
VFLHLHPEQRQDILWLHVEEEAAQRERGLTGLNDDDPAVAFRRRLGGGGIIAPDPIDYSLRQRASSLDDELQLHPHYGASMGWPP